MLGSSRTYVIQVKSGEERRVKALIEKIVGHELVEECFPAKRVAILRPADPVEVRLGTSHASPSCWVGVGEAAPGAPVTGDPGRCDSGF